MEFSSFNSTNLSKPRNQISPSNNYSLKGKIMLCSVIVLFVAVSVTICFHCYSRWLCDRRRRAQNRLVSLHIDGGASLRGAPEGLDLSVLAKLPTFVFMSLNDCDKIFECAVCLSEFEDGEEGRVLPKCKHVFHLECIDMWFHSHSNCPLCRVPVQDSDETKIVIEKAGLMVEPDDLVPGLKQGSQEGCSSSTLSEMGQQRREEFVSIVIEEPSSNGAERFSGLFGLSLDSTTNQRLKSLV